MKYITVDLTENQYSWIMTQAFIELSNDKLGEAEKSFIKRLRTTLAKAKTS